MARSTRNPETRVTTSARAVGHHGELLQGAFDRGGSAPRIGLVTLACPLVVGEAAFTPTDTPLEVEPRDRTKALAAARACCGRLGVPATGRLLVRSRTPAGRGLGSSTADVVAAIRAVAGAHGTRLSAGATARLAAAAEHAADPTMFARPHLFDPVAGRVLAPVTGELPRMIVLGLDLASRGDGLDTLATPRPSYSAAELDTFAVLWDRLRAAVALGDPAALGRIASCSAALAQRHRRSPGLDDVRLLAGRHRALGVQIAHTGTVAGLLFARDRIDDVGRCRRALARDVGSPTWVFTTGRP